MNKSAVLCCALAIFAAAMIPTTPANGMPRFGMPRHMVCFVGCYSGPMGGGGDTGSSSSDDGIPMNNGSVFYPTNLSVFDFHLIGIVVSDEPDTGGAYGQGSNAAGLQEAAIGPIPTLVGSNLVSYIDVVVLASPNPDGSDTYNWGAFIYQKASGWWMAIGGDPNARYTLEEFRKLIKTTEFLKKLKEMREKALKIFHDKSAYTGGGGSEASGSNTYRGSMILPERFCSIVSGYGPGTPWFSQVTSCYYRYTYLP